MFPRCILSWRSSMPTSQYCNMFYTSDPKRYLKHAIRRSPVLVHETNAELPMIACCCKTRWNGMCWNHIHAHSSVTIGMQTDRNGDIPLNLCISLASGRACPVYIRAAVPDVHRIPNSGKHLKRDAVCRHVRVCVRQRLLIHSHASHCHRKKCRNPQICL